MQDNENSSKMKTDESLGSCPICDREMIKDLFVDRHHFIPVSRGGKEWKWLHKVCHNKIHSLFTEKELERNFDTPEKLKAHPEISKFIEWIKNKPLDFYIKHDRHKDKKR